jgi:hypothetical protein
MRKKTARAPGTQAPRDVLHRGLIAKADKSREQSAAAEYVLDNLSHRTFRGRRRGADTSVHRPYTARLLHPDGDELRAL